MQEIVDLIRILATDAKEAAMQRRCTNLVRKF
jgi:hypothetical protein